MTKKLSFILLLLAGFSCKVSQKNKNYTAAPNSIFEFFQYDKSKRTMVSVHRGGGELKGFPENCLESFDYISKKMPCLIECDIEMTKDSVMVLMHDKTLDRTSTGKDLVVNNTFETVQKLKLKDNFGNVTNFKIPTLENTLKWGKNKVIFTLDVKKTTPYKSVVEMVDKLDAENYALIITYNANEAIEVYRLNPNLLISVSIMQVSDYERLHEAGIPDKNMVAFIGTREPKTELVEFLHKKGIMCILGVLGNLDKKAAARGNDYYKTFIDQGVDILATDRPEAVNEIINKL
ncbi:glycerophosphodiester phosphodiesterase family protein [Lacihabitans soyangensis]|uniref:Glycerophosphodiester phosphodiesterase n=1 Tax=Lacihabitans soyangensis TaxID=869394 RepID=A0AAE3H4B9_9BACT|nr:glycerophosphodiester phosphodiesterase family protein [Lacihabitans soyangensis]MCP9764523.1 glycerophosphodiester phosphodiesterase [Lacihabitans soyangensis]